MQDNSAKSPSYEMFNSYDNPIVSKYYHIIGILIAAQIWQHLKMSSFVKAQN